MSRFMRDPDTVRIGDWTAPFEEKHRAYSGEFRFSGVGPGIAAASLLLVLLGATLTLLHGPQSGKTAVTEALQVVSKH